MYVSEALQSLLILSVCSAMPLTNLKEQPPMDLTWLMLHDKGEPIKKTLETRRRITPKSIFIAPTRHPNSLPPCAEGYVSDSLGRCVKSVNLDEKALFKFLLDKLSDKFGNSDYDMEYDYLEEELTPEPYKINIPFGGNVRTNQILDNNIKLIADKRQVEKPKKKDNSDNVFNMFMNLMEGTEEKVAPRVREVSPWDSLFSQQSHRADNSWWYNYNEDVAKRNSYRMNLY